jgi:hypothetical protein
MPFHPHMTKPVIKKGETVFSMDKRNFLHRYISVFALKAIKKRYPLKEKTALCPKHQQ